MDTFVIPSGPRSVSVAVALAGAPPSEALAGAPPSEGMAVRPPGRRRSPDGSGPRPGVHAEPCPPTITTMSCIEPKERRVAVGVPWDFSGTSGCINRYERETVERPFTQVSVATARRGRSRPWLVSSGTFDTTTPRNRSDLCLSGSGTGSGLTEVPPATATGRPVRTMPKEPRAERRRRPVVSVPVPWRASPPGPGDDDSRP